MTIFNKSLYSDTTTGSNSSSAKDRLNTFVAGKTFIATAVGVAFVYVSAGVTAGVPGSESFRATHYDSASHDVDGDGITNAIDMDDDNDGILDSSEGNVDLDEDGVPDASSIDSDGDGIYDSLDLDSDNDGILDIYEARVDAKASQSLDQMPDGVIDADIPVGDNGIPDIIETSPDSGVLQYALPDSDNDGTPDFRDFDSDDDEIYDLVEIGGPDADTNGRVDDFFDGDHNGFDDDLQAYPYPLYETDGDGALDYRDPDSDNDGIPDSVEGGSSRSFPPDSDGDGRPDYRDFDSDNDGISDRREAGPDPVVPQDTDGDGIPDYLDDDKEEPVVIAVPPDYDGDGILNQVDLDDDNDGIPDLEEGLIDDDGDGVADQSSTDTDGDGIPDGYEADSDQDGIGDLIEGGGTDADSDGKIDGFADEDRNGVDDIVKVTTLPLFDTDNDFIRDYQDTDSDNDGLPDRVESRGPLGEPTDSDGDGIADYRERDSDNDGISDTDEAGADPFAPVDTDGDGIPDFQQAPVRQEPAAPEPGADHDSDGQADDVDTDDDNDGLPDAGEGAGDADGDGIVNSRDLDSDNDGIPDQLEGGSDSDNDGTADYLDLDSDNDGVFDAIEASRGLVSPNGRLATGAADDFGLVPGISDLVVDTDGDGVADRLDLDSDNDGLTDVLESMGTDTDLDARTDMTTDADADGVGDSLSDNAGLADDMDKDGLPNFRDLDSDGDGISDIVENFGSAADQDSNGLIDNFISDDFDGLDDNYAAALAPLRDTDSDGDADSLDLDSDDDGVTDAIEAGGTDENEDGFVDILQDSDEDGVPDVRQPLMDDAGAIETGLGGTGFGCSIASSMHIGSAGGRFDPLMAFMLIGSVVWFRLRASLARNVL